MNIFPRDLGFRICMWRPIKLILAMANALHGLRSMMSYYALVRLVRIEMKLPGAYCYRASFW